MDPAGAKERFLGLLLECSAKISRDLGYRD
jgi:hypothetical protein